ncbi:MAG: iron-sulfur cluster assembly scaffold protein, partial [Anaerolineae bacterium]
PADGKGMARNEHDGDTVQITIRVAGDTIQEARMKTQGCVAAIAASSMLTELVKGKALDDALAISQEQLTEELGGLPERKVLCSLTCIRALEEAIRGIQEPERENSHGKNQRTPDED